MSSLSSRQPLQPELAELEAPFLDWQTFYGWLAAEGRDGQQRFRQGDHFAIIGPTGTGKTHMAFEIAELRDYVIAVACKPEDPLIDDAAARGYHVLGGHTLEIPYVDGQPMWRKVVYWPRLTERKGIPKERILEREREFQKPAVGAAIGYVRENGKWCLLLDEGTWICRDLGLQRDVDAALNQFRSLKASLIILGQRPSWMGQYVLSQPTHLLLFHTAHTDDLKALGDISGVDTKVVQYLVRTLDRDRHLALYINTRERVMYRTVAPPR